MNSEGQPAGSHHDTLTSRTISGFLWVLSGAGAQAILKIVVLVILARLLTPADFGLVAAALIVVALADLFTQIGIAPSIVQAPALTQEHVRTAYTLTSIMGVAVAILVLIGAPWIEFVFQMPGIDPIVRALAVLFVFRGFSAVAEAILQREMRFREIAINGLVSYGVGYALIAVGMAWAGFGLWALVWGSIGQAALSGVGFLVQARHSLRPELDPPVLRHLFGFGTGLTLARIGNYLATNADNFIVGRALGADALGLYSRAHLLLMQPAQIFGSLSDKVLYPAMASIQSEAARFSRAYTRTLALIGWTTVPLSAVAIVFAPEIMEILLGGQWDGLVLPFQILAASLFFRTAYKVTTTVIRAKGAIFTLAAWQWIYAGAVILGAGIGQNYGLPGVSAGVSIAVVFNFWAGQMFARGSAGISLVAIAASVVRLVIAGVVAAALAYTAREALLALRLPSVLVAVIGVAVCALLMLLVLLVAPRLLGGEGVWIRDMLVSRLRRLGRRSMRPPNDPNSLQA